MNPLDRFLVRATVTDVADVTPRMRQIRLAGRVLHSLEWTPGQHVRVRVDTLSLRSYSVWNCAGGELELRILNHPEAGPGARWSRLVRPGQPVAFTRPQGRLVIRDPAPYHLFVGDETASVAFGALIRALPATARVHALIEVETSDDRLQLDHGSHIHWVPRNPAREPNRLVAALHALDLPGQPGVAYVAGEARTCQAVRRHLVAGRGWPRTSVIVKPFWAAGKRGLD